MCISLSLSVYIYIYIMYVHVCILLDPVFCFLSVCLSVRLFVVVAAVGMTSDVSGGGSDIVCCAEFDFAHDNRHLLLIGTPHLKGYIRLYRTI